MIDLGIVKPGSTIYVPFASFAGSTGASAATTGLATTDILVYKDGGTTERASQSGYTLLDTDGLDFDGKTGINGFSISLADNTTAGFWAAGSRYWIVVGDVTIDSQTVRFVAATFMIGLPGAVLNTTIATLSTQTSFTLTDGPAEDDALNGCIVYIHDVASAVQGGFAVVSDYTGASKTVTLVAGTTFTAAAADNIMVLPPSLMPTVLGRTIDISAGGEAGVDWANVGTPGSTVSLSATTVATVTTTTTATNVTTVNGLGAGVITAASIAADAITDAKVAADVTIASVTGAVGSVTGNVGGNVTGSVGSVVGLTASNLDATVSSRSTFAPTDALTESYAADGAAFTMAQALYQIWSMLAEANASGTTITCKKLDGSTTSMTFTIDNGATPTTITRAT